MALVGTRNVRIPGTPILVILPHQGTGSTSRTSPIHCAKAAQRRVSRFLLTIVRYTFPLPYTRQVQIRKPLSTIKFFVKACGYADATPLPNLLGRVHWERATKKLIIHNYSTLLYTYLRLVNSGGMLEHSVHEVRKLNARLNKNLDNYYGRGHNMPTEQNPEIYRTIKALTEIGKDTANA